MSAGTVRVAIVGGGISGLTAAYELSRGASGEQPEFVLFESACRLGGIVETVDERGFVVECGPDSWVSEKPWAGELAEELGLGAHILPSNDAGKRTYLAEGRMLTPMPDGMRMMTPTRWAPLLESPLFSWQAKLAYLREPKRAPELKQAALLARGEDADESVTEFVERHFGAEVAETVASPLLAGIFGGDAHRLSARSVLAPFVKLEADHGSLILGLQQRSNDGAVAPTFTTLACGLGALVDRMAAQLPAEAIRSGCAVQSLERGDAGWRVSSEGGSEWFDAVLLATPLAATRALLRSVREGPAIAAEALLPRHASSAVVVALGFDGQAARRMRIPRGFGFLVPQRLGVELREVEEQLLACTFMDQKFSDRAPEGGVLLRGFFGGPAAERLLGASDATVAETAHRQLSRVLGPLPAPQLTVVRRWPNSLPQYEVGHLARMKALSAEIERLPGLTLLGNPYRGVGLPDLVRDARQAARRILSQTRQPVPEKT